MVITVRRASSDDISILAALGTTTCYEAYFELDPSRDLADYCVRVYSPDAVRSECDDCNSTFLLAEIDGRAVGFAKLRENHPVDCVKGSASIELQRIYVLERTKGRGIGRALMTKCIRIAKELRYGQLWLGVWEKNQRAQQFYEDFGMRKVGTTGFHDGKSEFLNYVYAIDLVS